MAQPKSWKEVIAFVKDKPENKGKSLSDILKEASPIWKEIQSKNVSVSKAPAPAKKATKGKKAMKGGNQGDTETARIDLPQHELYGGVNDPKNVVRRPGMSVGGTEKGPEHSFMQEGAGEQLAAEHHMIDAFTTPQQGGRRRRGKTARKSRKATKAKRSGRKHRKTARKTRKNRKSARKHRK
jgi:hypothetical protein